MKLIIVAITISTGLLVGESDSYGQAYCALRDPTKRIYEFYPDATSFKSLVRTVDEGVRQYVASELPFTIHFNELGRHTLYVPVNQSKPMGLVHARSEAGDFGLTEIVWSLTPNLVVSDFEFQRCRSRKRSAVESEAFKRQIIGKDFHGLLQLLTNDGKQIVDGKLKVKSDSAEMAAIVVRSALKTIAVSRSAWQKDLAVIQPLYYVDTAYPNASQARKIDSPYNEQVKTNFDKHYVTSSGDVGSNVKRKNVMLLQAVDAKGESIGYVVKTPWKSMDYEMTLWWTVRKDMVIEDVVVDGGWPDEATQKAFKAVVGLAAAGVHDCSSAAEMVGAEVLMLCRHN